MDVVMSTRKCLPCNGTGILHGTPKLLVEGLVEPPKPDQRVLSRDDEPRGSYGLEIRCWRCLGKGVVPDTKDKGDAGEEL